MIREIEPIFLVFFFLCKPAYASISFSGDIEEYAASAALSIDRIENESGQLALDEEVMKSRRISIQQVMAKSAA